MAVLHIAGEKIEQCIPAKGNKVTGGKGICLAAFGGCDPQITCLWLVGCGCKHDMVPFLIIEILSNQAV